MCNRHRLSVAPPPVEVDDVASDLALQRSELDAHRPPFGDQLDDRVVIGRRKRARHPVDRGLQRRLVEGAANSGANGGAFTRFASGWRRR